MYSLIDCNSFFCSVEKAFHPGLDGKPVCVLSNNDGCIVALTPEAKAVGLRRGDPIFKVRDIVRHNDVKVFSSNIQLYAAMSRRILSIVRKSISHVECYSIDESFCDLSGYEAHFDLVRLMKELRERIGLWTDIPVSIGIAPTRTLAKIGSKFAKLYPGYGGVCMIDTETRRRKALRIFDLADVWGIGRRTFERLTYYGIHTPLEFADKSEAWVRAHLAKPGLQTWLELNGHPCITTAEVIMNQTICTSRSFGEMACDLQSLSSSVASFAASCANKLRAQNGGARAVTVFVSSNPFREELSQYHNSATSTLSIATSDTIEITQTALRLLHEIYREGIMYKKAGVILSDIVPANPLQQDLFDPVRNRQQRAELMKTIDSLNHRYGPKTVRLTAEGERRQAWMSKSANRTPNYLTDITSLLEV